MIFASVVSGFVLLACAAILVAVLMQRTERIAGWVGHTYQVETAIAELQLYVERTEIGRRSFLIDPSEFNTSIFERNLANFDMAAETLRALLLDNPTQLSRLDRVVELWAEHVGIMRRSMQERADGGTETSAAAIFDNTDIETVRQLRRVAQEMIEQERVLLADRTREQYASGQLTYLVLLVTGVLLVVLAVFTIIVTRRNLQVLEETGARLQLLNDDLETAVAERTHELRQANEEIQRFAYIISHDLRSPLVNVMGFTSELDAATIPLREMVRRVADAAPELVDDEVRLAVDEELPEAIGFIRSSTQKMDRLINAILRLSREGRRVLAPERLDMNVVVGSIVESIQHQLTETGTEIEVDTLPPIDSDRVAIEQIFSNLIENSVKYLKPGRPGRIVVSGHRRAGRLVYEVADNGRGIDPKDHQRIFDLFRRSGSQDRPGEGIGLAHVRALAYRLGGVVECESTLGEGATFRVSLPMTMRSGA
ncbi:sensor histidine kinase [Acuticoccus kandeliae]|uniref:sensor histidine kinase n=1 Tax=Acuticoccus kandeliae TaxID=2073160 RepID=UPI001475B369|nr:sensor histidine kinase [Acuticoccus kandeliae]